MCIHIDSKAMCFFLNCVLGYKVDINLLYQIRDPMLTFTGYILYEAQAEFH